MAVTDSDAGATSTPSGRSTATAQRRDNTYFLGRLRNGRPDLYAKVLLGSMSVYAASKLAGMRGPQLPPIEDLMHRVDGLSKEDFRTFFVQLLVYAKNRRH
jgi:hypothetical protein